MQNIKLAEALLRRKELQEQVDRLKRINEKDLFKVAVKRQKVTEDIDQVIASVPKVSFNQIDHAYNWHARRLRMIDLVIQTANHATVVEVDETVMADYKEDPELTRIEDRT